MYVWRQLVVASVYFCSVSFFANALLPRHASWCSSSARVRVFVLVLLPACDAFPLFASRSSRPAALPSEYIYILIDCQCVVWDSDLFWLIEELYFLTFLRYLVNSLTWTKQQLCDLVWNSHLWIFRFKGGWGGFPAKLQDVEFLIPPSLRSQPPKPSPGEPDWRTSRKQSKDDTPDNEFGKRVARFQLCLLSLQVKPLFLFWK